MIRRVRACNPKLLGLIYVSLLITGCTDQFGEKVGSKPIALQETNWNSAISGKTSGPIQLRYRMEEYDGRLFKLRIFARSAIGDLEGWNIDLMASGLKLSERSSAVLKGNSADSLPMVSRQFEFRDEARNLESVAVRVEVVIGNQLASKTLEVKLGSDIQSPIETCNLGEACERVLPANLK